MVLNLFIEGEAPNAQVEWEDETPEFDQFKVIGSDPLWGEIIEVPTVYGDLVRVSKKQLAETFTRLVVLTLRVKRPVSAS